MKIIEVRDGIIKYETAENVVLASFIKINNQVSNYVAQIIRIVYNGVGNTVYAKIMFNYDGEFLPYDKSLTNDNLNIETFDISNILKLIEVPQMTVLGKLPGTEKIFKINSDFMNKKTLLCADKASNVNNLINNILQSNSKVIIMDTEGITEGDKIIAGKDFKIPLNPIALNYIYSECITDATEESKSIIKDIFNNLSEYSLSVPFLPFEALKNVVDNMISTTHDFRIMVLKNKLAKFQKIGCFASEEKELYDIKSLAEKLSCVIDISGLSPDIQNLYLQSLADDLVKNDTSIQIIALLNSKINKKTISSFYNSDLNTLFGVKSTFRYLKGIKPLFNDFILEANAANCDLFGIYKPLFSSMGNNELLVAGSDTNNIPFIITADKLSNVTEKIAREELITSLEEEIEGLDDTENDNVSDSEENINELENKPDEEAPVSLFDDDEYHTQVDDTKITESEEKDLNNAPSEEIQVSDEVEGKEFQKTAEDETLVEINSKEIDSEIMDEIEALDNIEPEKEESADDNQIQDAETEQDAEIIEEQDIQDDVTNSDALQSELETVSEENSVNPENLDVIPLDNQNDDNNLDIVELDSSEASDDDIMVELEPEISQNDDTDEELDKEIIEDVDKVFTTVKDDTISDVDLDLIDELNELDSNVIYEPTEVNNDTSDDSSLDSEFEELEIQPDEDDTLDEPLTELSDSLEPATDTEILETKSSSTPIVPVYDAEIPPEDMVSSDPVEQGDTVIHAKYGTGVVEKMIKYGNKNLYSINFENVGRRLLDPALTEIKKA